MEGIFYSCLICLYLFDLGFPENQRDKACNGCLENLFKEPEINENLYYIERIMKENQLSFDDQTFPFLRGTLEEKIEYAYKNTEAYNMSRTLLTGSDFRGHLWNEMSKNFFNILREIYQYEQDVKSALEEQRQRILKKIEEVLSEYMKKRGKRPFTDNNDGFGGVKEKFENTIVFGRMKQEEARRSVTILAINERMNLMKRYLKMVADFYMKLEQLRYEDLHQSWEALKGEFESRPRELLIQEAGFEEIFLKLRNVFEEFEKEIDGQPDGYIDVFAVFKKFGISPDEHHKEYSRILEREFKKRKEFYELFNGSDL